MSSKLKAESSKQEQVRAQSSKQGQARAESSKLKAAAVAVMTTKKIPIYGTFCLLGHLL
jgi:hypothetical protein